MQITLRCKKITLVFFVLSFIHVCCYSQMQSIKIVDKQKIKDEIREVEKNFQDDLKRYGVQNAFYKYASEKAVIKREKDSLIFGNLGIKNYYSKSAYKNASAEWKPDFVDISDDGSMAYTYGRYKWSFTDEAGKTTMSTGIFHTVWKRMRDGSWKYVWD